MKLLATTGLVSGIFLLACSPADQRYAQPFRLSGPVALESSVAYVESSSATLFMIDPAAATLRARRVLVGQDPLLPVRRAQHDEMMVLCRGERGQPGVPQESPSLRLVPADETKPVRVVPLGTRFNTLSQSDDGRFVLAHSGPTQGDLTADLLLNPNEIAIVDMDAPTPKAVSRTVRSFGSVPLGVTFSGELNLPEGPRRLAVVRSQGYVTIIDLTNPTRTEITVPLLLPDDRRVVTPTKVIFESKDKEPTIFVLASGADDIYALRLVAVPAAERSADGNDFRPVLSQLGAGRGPADMAIFGAEGQPRLLVVSAGSQDAYVIDARSSRSTRIQLEAPANRIYLFEDTSPAQPTKSLPRALLTGIGTEARVVSFLDLDQIEDLKQRNLETSRPLAAPATDLRLFPLRGAAVLSHQGKGIGIGLSVIDLRRRSISPLGSQSLPGVVEAPAPSDKLWIAANPGAGGIQDSTGQTIGYRVAFLSLGDLSGKEVRVDAPVQQILPLGRSRDMRSRVILTHPSPVGYLTVLDGESPDRTTARSLQGFLLDDLLERGVK